MSNYWYPQTNNPYFYSNSMQMPQMQPQSQPMTSTSILNGKLVDSIDMVKATEVPIGGYGIFPKADLSEIYIKSWNNNGTTNISIYKIVTEDMSVGTSDANSNLSKFIEEGFNSLNTKVNNLISILEQKPEGKANVY